MNKILILCLANFFVFSGGGASKPKASQEPSELFYTCKKCGEQTDRDICPNCPGFVFVNPDSIPEIIRQINS